jgi:plastocyanin
MVPRIVSSREDVRQVTLVVRNMTYYVEGSDVPNPELRFRAGEQVRVTLRNEDAGMSHDFNIRDWGVATKILDGKGEEAVRFRVPSAGTTTYSCTPHAAMMSGSIIVE